jgi:ABC-type glutathione transport system ATPase component
VSSPATAERTSLHGPEAGALLVAEDLAKHYELPRGGPWHAKRVLRAVDGVSFALRPGETLGVVGESGSGKSTLGRLIVGLIRPTRGSVKFEGREVGGARGSALKQLRQDIQVVFQDPYTSLDPKMAVEDSIAEPLRAYGRYGRRTGQSKVHELLERVGISPAYGRRLPREFSGGQCQRIGIARALALEPKLLILDEPVSALDVSVQAQVLNLLRDLQDDLGVAYILISHDLSVVRHVAQRVAVMYLGRFVETGDTEVVYG